MDDHQPCVNIWPDYKNNVVPLSMLSWLLLRPIYKVPGTERYMYDRVVSVSPILKKGYLVHHMDAIEVSHRAGKEEFLRLLTTS